MWPWDVRGEGGGTVGVNGICIQETELTVSHITQYCVTLRRSFLELDTLINLLCLPRIVTMAIDSDAPFTLHLIAPKPDNWESFLNIWLQKIVSGLLCGDLFKSVIWSNHQELLMSRRNTSSFSNISIYISISLLEMVRCCNESS